MLTLLNTLYVMTQGAYLHLDHETLKVEVEGKLQLQVPIHHLGAVVCVGNVLISPAALHRCAMDGRTVTLLDHRGRFRARLEGPASGNVLLRRAQHLALGDEQVTTNLARHIVAGKIQNTRHCLMRSARETDGADAEALAAAADRLATSLPILETAADVDVIRGLEGDAARTYFAAFDLMVRHDRDTFRFVGRSRRPPTDPINALLSFLYTLLVHDTASAVQGVGLDVQVGYLHVLRPGRPALALDMAEELRPVLAERLALTLINRRQLAAGDFEARPGGAVYLNEAGRKAVITAYQKRKQDEVPHPLLAQKTPLGLVPHVQARLLARFLRGDTEAYIPFLYR